jgi:hypothetical protein
MFTARQLSNAEHDIDNETWYRRSSAAARNEVYRQRNAARKAEKQANRKPVRWGKVWAIALVAGVGLPFLMAVTSSVWLPLVAVALVMPFVAR